MDLGNPLWFLEPKTSSAQSKIIKQNSYNSNTSQTHLPQKQQPVQPLPSPQVPQRQIQSQHQSVSQIQHTTGTSSNGDRRPQTPVAPRFQPIVAAPQTKSNAIPAPLKKPEPICQINNRLKSENNLDRHGCVRAPRVSVAQSSLTLGESFNAPDNIGCLYDRNVSDSDDNSCDVASVLSKASTRASSSRRSIKSGRCDKRERRRQHHNQKQQLSQQAKIRSNDKRDTEIGNGTAVQQSRGESDQEYITNETSTSSENSSGLVNDNAKTIVPRICRRRKFNKLTTYLPTLSLGLSTAIILLSDRRSVASVLMAALHATRNIPYLF